MDKELSDLVNKMQDVADSVYAMFFHTGMGAQAHAFLEFNGLLQKYVGICRSAAQVGIDFRHLNRHTGKALPIADHDVTYLVEKLDCIFGEALRSNERFKQIFMEGLFGCKPEHRGKRSTPT